MRGSTTKMVPAALAAALLVLGACGSEATQEPAGAEAAGDSKSSPEAAGPTEEMITATEYEFDAPQTLAAGEVTLNFHNAGKEPHEMLVFRINDESSVEELLKLPQKEAMKHITEVGAAFAKPGRTAKKPLTADLEAGRYAMVCFVPAPDKTPHAFKGMVAEFQVTQ